MAITGASSAWGKWLVKAGVEVGGALAGYLVSQLTGGSSDNAVTDVQWRRYQILYTRTTPAGTTEDRAGFSIDIVNLTSGAIDTTWTAGDYTTVFGLLGPMVVAFRPYQSSNHDYTSMRAYQMQFNPAGWPSKPFADSGPPVDVHTAGGTPGSGTGVLPYQVAMSVTERTAFPGHWGRFYLPGPAASTIDTYGRFTSTARTGVASAVETAFEGLATAGFHPVVPMTQHNKGPAFGLLSVPAIAVDDIPDIQRRRRPRQVLARAVEDIST